MDILIAFIWDKYCATLSKRRITILDSMFTSVLTNKFMCFTKKKQSTSQPWHPLLVSYVSGDISGRHLKSRFLHEVDVVYLPMNWGKKHWVALCIYLQRGHIEILDPFVDFTPDRKVLASMSRLAKSLPDLIRSVCGETPSTWPADRFTFEQIPGLS